MIDAQLDGMSDDDIGRMIDDIADRRDINIPLPDEITRKYKTEQSPEYKAKATMNSDKPYEKIAAIIKKLE